MCALSKIWIKASRWWWRKKKKKEKYMHTHTHSLTRISTLAHIVAFNAAARRHESCSKQDKRVWKENYQDIIVSLLQLLCCRVAQNKTKQTKKISISYKYLSRRKQNTLLLLLLLVLNWMSSFLCIFVQKHNNDIAHLSISFSILCSKQSKQISPKMLWLPWRSLSLSHSLLAMLLLFFL